MCYAVDQVVTAAVTGMLVPNVPVPQEFSKWNATLTVISVPGLRMSIQRACSDGWHDDDCSSTSSNIVVIVLLTMFSTSATAARAGASRRPISWPTTAQNALSGMCIPGLAKIKNVVD